MPAPIVLFAYNRPQHTLKTLESLMQNDLAEQSQLFIYCDGPRANATKEELSNIQEVRKIIRQKKWCATVQIFESDTNITHPINLINRVTEIIDQYEKIIVLEDDLVLGKGFLKFMNEALDLYENEPKVMNISGHLWPVLIKNLPETFFLHYMDCWGWATWKRAWDEFMADPNELLKLMGNSKDTIHRFNMEGSQNFYGQLELCATNAWKSWAIRWYATIFIKDGLVLYPKKSLVRNIGNDGTGTNCADDPFLTYQSITDYITVKPIELKENRKARRGVKQAYLFLYDNRFFSFNNFKNFARKIIPHPIYNYFKNRKNEYLMRRAALK